MSAVPNHPTCPSCRSERPQMAAVECRTVFVWRLRVRDPIGAQAGVAHQRAPSTTRMAPTDADQRRALKLLAGSPRLHRVDHAGVRLLRSRCWHNWSATAWRARRRNPFAPAGGDRGGPVADHRGRAASTRVATLICTAELHSVVRGPRRDEFAPSPVSYARGVYPSSLRYSLLLAARVTNSRSARIFYFLLPSFYSCSMISP
jgi:hypothetical protein